MPQDGEIDHTKGFEADVLEESATMPAAGGARRPVTGEAMRAALREGAPIVAPAVVLAAHPDDETLGLGGRLGAFAALTLIHATDGAPPSPADARAAGFADGGAYAAARARELERSLAALGVAPRRLMLGLGDQTAVMRLRDLIRALLAPLSQASLVVTHAYEGGHPDHDACACAVQAACRDLRRRGARAPLRLEFAGYHQREGRRVTGAFHPSPGRPAVAARLTPAQLARKRRALGAFRSQAAVIGWFDPAIELYRQAPDYDFARPPPPGAALYDGFGWELTSERWRAQVAQAGLQEVVA